MKRKIALVAVLLLVVGLLVSCGNPETLAGTTWEYTLLTIGGGWRFDSTTEVTYYITAAGVDEDLLEYTYDYDGENVQLYNSYNQASWKGVVDGNKLEMSDGFTYKKK